MRLPFSLSVAALLLAVAGYLAFAPPSHPAKRALAVLLAVLAFGQFTVFQVLDPNWVPRSYASAAWFYLRTDLTILANLAFVGFLWLYPTRPPLRSWHTALAAFAGSALLAGALLWVADKGVLAVERAGGATTNALFALLVWDAGPVALFLALLVSALARARALGGSAERAAYVLLPMVLAAPFTFTGRALVEGVATMLGAGPWPFPSAVPPGDCCGVVPAVALLGWGFLPLALWLAARRGSRAALALVAAGVVVAVPMQFTELNWSGWNHLWAALGTMYVVGRYAPFGDADVPARMHYLIAAFTVVAVFLMVTAFTASLTQNPFGLALSILLGAVLGLGGAVAVLPEGRAWALALFGGDSEDTRRRLAAYRTALQRELETGSTSQDISRRLRALRLELGITDRDHAVIEHTLRAAGASGSGGAGPAMREGKLFLNRYRVARRLGEGGSGATYLCRDEQLGRDVVIKHLHASGTTTDGLAAALREARAIAAIRHPHVVTLYDVEQLGDEAFTVMEHLEGGSLADRLRRGPLRGEEFRRASVETLRALEAVHGAGLVHRDLKLSNILLTRDGQAKLADFGIAQMTGFETTVAPAGGGSAVGTIRFMSPEQARGRPVTRRSDLFSLAATMFEAYTGEPYLEPRKDESAVELQMRAAAPRPFQASLEPAPLRAWFARALDPDPERRFDSSTAMREALERALPPEGAPEAAGRRAPTRGRAPAG